MRVFFVVIFVLLVLALGILELMALQLMPELRAPEAGFPDLLRRRLGVRHLIQGAGERADGAACRGYSQAKERDRSADDGADRPPATATRGAREDDGARDR